jgi:polysaccharide pyruvyl transferase WcaK-like protein
MLVKMPPRNICISNFTGFRANWGCQATSWELLKFINGCFLGHHPHRVTLVPLLPHCEMDVALDGRLADIYAAVSEVTGGGPEAKRAIGLLEELCIERYDFWADDVRSADLVFFQGEGTISGVTDFSSGVGLLLLPFVAKHAWGKPVISLNQTIFGQDSELLRVFRMMFNSFDFVGVREGASLEFAKSFGVNPCHFIPDAAFLTRPSPDPRLPKPEPSKGLFCVTDSASRGPHADEQIFFCADRIRAETGLTPVLAISKSRRLINMARSHWSGGTYEVLDPEVNYRSVAHTLKECEFLVGGRYHMGIMAAAVGTPTILLTGNTFKNEGLAAMLQAPFPVRTFDDTNEIVADAQFILKHRESERCRLSSAVARIRDCISEGQLLLSDIIAGRSDVHSITACPPTTTVSRELIGNYIESTLRARPTAAKRSSGLTNRSSLEERVGRRPTIPEVLSPLICSLRGDTEAIKITVNQLLGTVSPVRRS